MSYIPSWCKRKYIQGIYSKGLYQNVLKISLVSFTKAKCIKSIGHEQAVEQASTPFLNRKQDNQSHCFDLRPPGVPYNSCNPLNSTQLKHNTGKSKGVLQLNIRDNLGRSSCASYSLGPGPFSRTVRPPRRGSQSRPQHRSEAFLLHLRCFLISWWRRWLCEASVYVECCKHH